MAVGVVAALLESDLDFNSRLTQADGSLVFYAGGHGKDDNPNGQIEIEWSAEVESRDWGIKDIIIHIKRLKLAGWFEDEDGNDTGETFAYTYPEIKPPTNIGAAVDEPTPDNVYRLAAPAWKVSWQVDPRSLHRTSFSPAAEVDMAKHTIEITF